MKTTMYIEGFMAYCEGKTLRETLPALPVAAQVQFAEGWTIAEDFVKKVTKSVIRKVLEDMEII